MELTTLLQPPKYITSWFLFTWLSFKIATSLGQWLVRKVVLKSAGKYIYIIAK